MKYGASVKHTAITPPGGKRAFRLDSLGDGYTEADIRTRLAAVRSGDILPPPAPKTIVPKRYTVKRRTYRQGQRRKLHGFRALYIYYLYLLGGPRLRKRKPPSFAVRADVAKLRQYQWQFSLLQKYRIDSDSQLATLGEALQAQIDALTDSRKDLYARKRGGEDVAEEIAAVNGELRRLRRELKTCGRIEADIPRIRERTALYQEQRTQDGPVRDRSTKNLRGSDLTGRER